MSGKPGTGKTIVATYLVKQLIDDKEVGDKVALVVPMTSLRRTIKSVFKQVPGLKPNMVIGPSDVVKEKYDILIIDESHRLKQRKNIPNYGSFDATNKKLGFGEDGTELDWILASAKHTIFFYDKNQSIRPSDVNEEIFTSLGITKKYELQSQMRVEAGDEYINYISDILEMNNPQKQNFEGYDLCLFGDISEMRKAIIDKNKKYGLCRMVAGYAWPWVSRNDYNLFDIEIDGEKFKWNTINQDWVNSPNAINEMGSIHTTQGYDLNYVGVVIGPELKYSKEKGIYIDLDNYYDKNGKRGVQDHDELHKYIINIYKTLLTRGIRGTYLYVVDESLRNMLAEMLPISGGDTEQEEIDDGLVESPIEMNMVEIPLVGSAPCGNPLLGEENVEEYIDVEQEKIKPGFEYFILQADGDSMNEAGIEDGDLVLCRQQRKADTADRVVALLGEDVTIKVYGPREDGVRLLLPKSTNPIHQPITPGEGDSVLGIVQEIL